MKVKLILPALTEATSPFFRPIKYSLFPPLGLATLAAYLDPLDDVTLVDEHVEPLSLDDDPDLVAIETYISSARRSYAIADHYRDRGVHVVLGGLHASSLPGEALQHADTVCLGPGEDPWPRFLRDFRARAAHRVYRSCLRSLIGAPMPRHDLIRRSLYLVPNALVASRGCPHACDFCYKPAFFAGGRGHYVQAIDRVLAEIERLPGRHLYFLDDHLFADRRFVEGLCDGLSGMNRVWQASGTVAAVLAPGMMERAAAAGLRSLFVGFETLVSSGLASSGKTHNLGCDYGRAVRRLHDLGVMVNGSFVFGLDEHDDAVFGRTVEWAVEHGVETSTYHVLTPYPGTRLFERLRGEGRILSRDWDLYDTRHAVFMPRRMTPTALEEGYWRAYRDFYRWSTILRGVCAHDDIVGALRHAALAVAWKKVEPLWRGLVAVRRVADARPALEAVLGAEGTRRRSSRYTEGHAPSEPASIPRGRCDLGGRRGPGAAEPGGPGPGPRSSGDREAPRREPDAPSSLDRASIDRGREPRHGRGLCVDDGACA